jgi:hypothetical protein
MRGQALTVLLAVDEAPDEAKGRGEGGVPLGGGMQGPARC